LCPVRGANEYEDANEEEEEEDEEKWNIYCTILRTRGQEIHNFFHAGAGTEIYIIFYLHDLSFRKPGPYFLRININ
jgi:hypothetical protein